MNRELTENKVFEKITFTENNFLSGVYEECRFQNCDGKKADFSGITFRSCSFDGCDLSLALFRNSVLQDVKFLNSKLLGVQFSECRNFLLQLDFQNCMLKLALFSKLKLKNTRFKNCDLQEVDFTDADLAESIFEHCDLLLATFFKTNLEKADFRSALNYSINPETNRISKASFSIPAVIGLLDKYNIEIE
ncbi:MAG: pentapeptide repeat-containing protein [Chlorobiaceae bacterium]